MGGILDGDLYSNTAIYGGWFLMPTELIAENSVSFNVSIRLIVKANDTGLEHTTISLEKLVDMSDGLTLTTMQEAIASKEATIRQVGISIIGVTLFLLLLVSLLSQVQSLQISQQKSGNTLCFNPSV